MTRFYKTRSDGLTITLHVQPRAKKTEITGTHGEALKIKVAAPPVDGAANEELIKFFAKFFEIPKSSVQIKAGDLSRHKILEIAGMTEVQFIEALQSAGAINADP